MPKSAFERGLEAVDEEKERERTKEEEMRVEMERLTKVAPLVGAATLLSAGHASVDIALRGADGLLQLRQRSVISSDQKEGVMVSLHLELDSEARGETKENWGDISREYTTDEIMKNILAHDSVRLSLGFEEVGLRGKDQKPVIARPEFLGRMEGDVDSGGYPLIVSPEWDQWSGRRPVRRMRGMTETPPQQYIAPGTERYQAILNYIQLALALEKRKK